MTPYEKIFASLRSSSVGTLRWESPFLKESREFFVFPESRTNWPEIGGVVVLAYHHPHGRVSSIHIGMTSNFDRYFSISPEVGGARKRGITHIHLFPSEDKNERVSLRRLLKEANSYR